jgi:hypothetical protein
MLPLLRDSSATVFLALPALVVPPAIRARECALFPSEASEDEIGLDGVSEREPRALSPP